MYNKPHLQRQSREMFKSIKRVALATAEKKEILKEEYCLLAMK